MLQQLSAGSHCRPPPIGLDFLNPWRVTAPTSGIPGSLRGRGAARFTKPGGDLGVRRAARPGHEQAAAGVAHWVLPPWPFFRPAPGVRAPLETVPVVGARRADAERLRSRRHVVRCPPPGGAADPAEEPDPARSGASNTLSWPSRGYSWTRNIRLWHSRICAAFPWVVAPDGTTCSWLQSNG